MTLRASTRGAVSGRSAGSVAKVCLYRQYSLYLNLALCWSAQWVYRSQFFIYPAPIIGFSTHFPLWDHGWKSSRVDPQDTLRKMNLQRERERTRHESRIYSNNRWMLPSPSSVMRSPLLPRSSSVPCFDALSLCVVCLLLLLLSIASLPLNASDSSGVSPPFCRPCSAPPCPSPLLRSDSLSRHHRSSSTQYILTTIQIHTDTHSNGRRRTRTRKEGSSKAKEGGIAPLLH